MTDLVITIRDRGVTREDPVGLRRFEATMTVDDKVFRVINATGRGEALTEMAKLFAEQDGNSGPAAPRAV